MAIATGSWTNPGPAQDDQDDTILELDGHSQDTPKRKPPPNPHSLQAHATSWIENKHKPSFAQFQLLLYKALLDKEPEESAELIDNHFESDKAWAMVSLARDTKGTIGMLHSIAQTPTKPSPGAPASAWYNKMKAKPFPLCPNSHSNLPVYLHRRSFPTHFLSPPPLFGAPAVLSKLRSNSTNSHHR
jgi:hypothetical protein